jgi:hypothetical protein
MVNGCSFLVVGEIQLPIIIGMKIISRYTENSLKRCELTKGQTINCFLIIKEYHCVYNVLESSNEKHIHPSSKLHPF